MADHRAQLLGVRLHVTPSGTEHECALVGRSPDQHRSRDELRGLLLATPADALAAAGIAPPAS